MRRNSWRWVVAVVLGFGPLAFADKTETYSSANVRLDAGTFRRLDDGTFEARACGATSRSSDGAFVAPAVRCVQCAAATWAGLPAACVAAWRAANGL